jgi:hypothetical protein
LTFQTGERNIGRRVLHLPRASLTTVHTGKQMNRAILVVRVLAWLVIGAAIPLHVTALGLLALPAALVAAVVIVVTGGPRRAELAVLAIGAGLAVLTIGGFALFGGTGFDPLPWLAVGVALGLLGALSLSES